MVIQSAWLLLIRHRIWLPKFTETTSGLRLCLLLSQANLWRLQFSWKMRLLSTRDSQDSSTSYWIHHIWCYWNIYKTWALTLQVRSEHRVMDLVAVYILCVSMIILFLGILSYTWLKIVEYEFSALRARSVLQNFGYPMEGPASHVERYIVTVANPPVDISRGNSKEGA